MSNKLLNVLLNGLIVLVYARMFSLALEYQISVTITVIVPLLVFHVYLLNNESVKKRFWFYGIALALYPLIGEFFLLVIMVDLVTTLLIAGSYPEEIRR